MGGLPARFSAWSRYPGVSGNCENQPPERGGIAQEVTRRDGDQPHARAPFAGTSTTHMIKDRFALSLLPLLLIKQRVVPIMSDLQHALVCLGDSGAPSHQLSHRH